MSISQTEMPEMPETGALRVGVKQSMMMPETGALREGVKQSMMTKQRSNPSKNV